VEAQRLAAFLMMFKNRRDRSYEALANRVGMSSSSLHRYCVGACVPIDYGMIQRFARECGATQPELYELHRLWTLADARRNDEPTPALVTEIAIPVTAPQRMRWLVFVGAAAALLVVSAWKAVSGKQRQQM
jgi:hypothetical protein